MTGYLPILLLGFAAAVISLSVIFLVALIGPKRPNKYKMSVIECGVPPSGDAKKRFSVKFYLVAISFLLFDVEVALLFPWALAYRKYLDASGLAILFAGLFFLLMITAAFVYEWRRGGLEWE